MKEQDAIKQQADVVKNFLKQQGIDLSHGRALDLVSRLCGDKEWNALSARLKTQAPGATSHRYKDVLKHILEVVSAAHASLDDASTVVDASDDEEFAYEDEIGAVEKLMENLRALISGEQAVKPEGLTLFEFTSIESKFHLHFLVPASVDIGKFEVKLHEWVAARQKETSEADNSEDEKAQDEAYAKWTDTGVIAEAIRLGAFYPHKVRSSQHWDEGQFNVNM